MKIYKEYLKWLPYLRETRMISLVKRTPRSMAEVSKTKITQQTSNTKKVLERWTMLIESPKNQVLTSKETINQSLIKKV